VKSRYSEVHILVSTEGQMSSLWEYVLPGLFRKTDPLRSLVRAKLPLESNSYSGV